MGYCISMINENFEIVDVGRLAEIIDTIQLPDNHYGWATQKELDGCDTWREKFNVFGWDVDDEHDPITSIQFIGEKLSDDEEVLFAAIAPVVTTGSFIEMMGEDGLRWRWLFSCGTVGTEYGRIVYD